MIELKFAKWEHENRDDHDSKMVRKLKNNLIYNKYDNLDFHIKIVFASYGGNHTETLELSGSSIAETHPNVDCVNIEMDYGDLEIEFLNSFSRQIYRKQVIPNNFLLYFDIFEKPLKKE